jgi:hypothetical protein
MPVMPLCAGPELNASVSQTAARRSGTSKAAGSRTIERLTKTIKKEKARMASIKDDAKKEDFIKSVSFQPSAFVRCKCSSLLARNMRVLNKLALLTRTWQAFRRSQIVRAGLLV